MEQGTWTLTLVQGVAGFFLCFAEENGLKPGSFHSPKLGNLLIKTFLLPDQLLCCTCVWWQAAEPALFGNSGAVDALLT